MAPRAWRGPKPFTVDGLGLPTQGIVGWEFEDGAVAFFNMDDGLGLVLRLKTSLAQEAKIPPRSQARWSFP